MSAQIVCLGHDITLLQTRKWLLQDFARVVVITGLGQLANFMSAEEAKIVILCHSLEPEERARAIEQVGDCMPQATVICLFPLQVAYVPKTEDAFVSIDGSPASLVNTVVNLLQTSSAYSSPALVSAAM